MQSGGGLMHGPSLGQVGKWFKKVNKFCKNFTNIHKNISKFNQKKPNFATEGLYSYDRKMSDYNNDSVVFLMVFLVSSFQNRSQLQ